MSALVIQELSDVDQAILHLFTRLKLQRMELRIATLPSLVVQRTQHHISRTFERCNCVLGEALAAVTLLGGAGYVWTMSLGWRPMVLVMIGALYAGLVGKGVEMAWTRLRLLQLLKALRSRLVADADINAAQAASDAAVYKGQRPPTLRAPDATPRDLAPRVTAMPQMRERLVLRDAADVNRMILQLFTRWTLPRAEVHIDGLSPLETQRSQHRLASLSGRCNCMLGGLLGAATLLGGSTYVVLSSTYYWSWTAGRSWDWQPLVWVAACTLSAAMAGWMIEAAWTRASMLRVLKTIQHTIPVHDPD